MEASLFRWTDASEKCVPSNDNCSLLGILYFGVKVYVKLCHYNFAKLKFQLIKKLFILT